MSLDADVILDRRKLKRRLSLWRAAAVIALVLLLAFFVAGPGDGVLGGAHIARLNVVGIITTDRDRDDAVREVANDENVKALIVYVDSPGGTTVGAETLHDAIREVAEKKPVVAVMGNVAASGGYIAAIAADHIVAQGNTITGSIGVLFQNADISKLLEKVGVDVEQVASGPLKGRPSPFEPMDDRTRQAIELMVEDSYDWFVSLVAERRPIDAVRARELADGRIFSGRQALDRSLVDSIGGEEVARTWLAEQKNISTDLPVQDVEYGVPTTLIERMVESTAGALAEKVLKSKPLNLDGLVSVWQPFGD